MRFPVSASEWRLGGIAASAWIGQNRRALVGHAMEALRSGDPTTADADPAASAELLWVVDYNIALFVRLFEQPHRGLDEATGSDLVASAANRAAGGSPIESLLDNYVAGTAAIWGAMQTMLAGREEPDLVRVTAALFDYLRGVVVLVARGFQHEESRISAGRRDARFAVYSALIEGQNAVSVAAHAGLPLATDYLVLAMRFGASVNAWTDGRSAEVPRLRRLNEAQRVLDDFATGDVLSLIRDPSGTALVPIDGEQVRTAGEWMIVLADRLSEAVDVPVHLGAVVASVDGIPGALAQAEEILELVTAIGLPAGAWQLDDVLLPYQLTRPGPARDALVRRLAVLDAHPDWEQTIRTYLACGSDRNRTAKELHVHPNTVDYRLGRFARATGLDAADRATASAVQAGVWVRDLVRAQHLGV